MEERREFTTVNIITVFSCRWKQRRVWTLAPCNQILSNLHCACILLFLNKHDLASSPFSLLISLRHLSLIDRSFIYIFTSKR